MYSKIIGLSSIFSKEQFQSLVYLLRGNVNNGGLDGFNISPNCIVWRQQPKDTTLPAQLSTQMSMENWEGILKSVAFWESCGEEEEIDSPELVGRNNAFGQ